MISAGNDIVSFAEINPVRTTQPAFYKKFLTDIEVSQYQKLPGKLISFEHYVWLLWSAKEASFKHLQRFHPPLVFSPLKFVVTVDRAQKVDTLLDPDDIQPDTEYICYGQIIAAGAELSFESFLCSEYVHTVICDSMAAGKSHQGVRRIADPSPQHQSEKVREFCLEKLSRVKFEGKFDFIKSEHGVPSISDVQSGLTYPVSFSHHGQFVAYSFKM
ncbi:4'-phosphopantetheinyl transferase superfamily protein [Mucilaginibacter glaciei]|uniref:4'-phosphopantetheinyl transferase superfamily protein n=1 Tax=Mucilaginibacter glaciei TaxID=2772109 RepID=A0A926S4D9_9SPHI|nr:4'-phosphopantetheinyl transferase superfamily protein [Mucilaginibacter glaciei]MBD1391691.1 4'-phosphopantetheinyl transferase superfamily protein [Mucilaginibacter glaciei]